MTAYLETLNSPEFCDQPPREVFQRLLEKGIYLCRVSSMYRILRANNQQGERRHQRRSQKHAAPRLYANQPNQVWTWDITKLATQNPREFLNLYVVLDLFSRYVVKWMVARKENGALAKQLMQEALLEYDIAPKQLTIHQDRGAPMIAQDYLKALCQQKVTASHSRPRVSNDNPFSESQFKTLKYQPDYPKWFDSQAHAQQWCAEYFAWYNTKHHHSGLNGYTPEQVFTGQFEQIQQQKQSVLTSYYEKKPERFSRGLSVSTTNKDRL